MSFKSVFSNLAKKGQKISDPLSHILGDKYTNFVSETIPREQNRIGSQIMRPFEKVDKKVNPIRKIPVVDTVFNKVAERPGDAIGAAIGAYFAYPVIAGALGGAGGGATTAVGEVAAGGGMSSADAAALYGAEGYGAGMTGAETAAFDAGSTAAPAATQQSSFDPKDWRQWQRLAGQRGNLGQQQQQQQRDPISYEQAAQDWNAENRATQRAALQQRAAMIRQQIEQLREAQEPSQPPTY